MSPNASRRIPAGPPELAAAVALGVEVGAGVGSEGDWTDLA